jgi:hypothetical protein
MVLLRRVGNSVQLVARNTTPARPAGTPLGRAVAESYSDSLLGAVPLAAAPHPSASRCWWTRTRCWAVTPGTQTCSRPCTACPMRWTAPTRRSSARVRTQPDLYLTCARTSRCPSCRPRRRQPPAHRRPTRRRCPTRRATCPMRAACSCHTYTLAPLPAHADEDAPADPRVGYFTRSFIDFGDDTQEGRRTHLIERWRLEKKDPTAAVSEPKEPIRVVLDRNIPERGAPRCARRRWSGTRPSSAPASATRMRVEQQPEMPTGPRSKAPACWPCAGSPGRTGLHGRGPEPVRPAHRRDPARRGHHRREPRARAPRPRRRGAASAVRARRGDAGRVRQAATASAATPTRPSRRPSSAWNCWPRAAPGPQRPRGRALHRRRAEGRHDARDRPRAGAAPQLPRLGHRHARAAARPAFTRANGLSSSVMEYNALNLPLEGEAGGRLLMPRWAHYDYWAIEYGYREFADPRTRQARAEGPRRSRRPRPAAGLRHRRGPGQLRPAGEPARHGQRPAGLRAAPDQLARELWQRTTARPLAADDDLTCTAGTLDRVLFRWARRCRWPPSTWAAPTPRAHRPAPTSRCWCRCRRRSSVRRWTSCWRGVQQRQLPLRPARSWRGWASTTTSRAPRHIHPGVDFSLPAAVLRCSARARRLMSEGLAGGWPMPRARWPTRTNC